MSFGRSPKKIAKDEKRAEKVQNWDIPFVGKNGSRQKVRFRGTQAEMFAEREAMRKSGIPLY